MIFSGPAAVASRTGQAQANQDRPQRPLPVRLGQEVQEVPRHGGVESERVKTSPKPAETSLKSGKFCV